MGIFADTIKVVRSNIFKSILKNGDYSVKTLSFSKKIIVDLPSDEEASFDGSADITTGTKGVLPLTKGGTGATEAGEARKKLGTVYCGRHSDKRDVGMGSSEDYMWMSFYDTSSGKSEDLNYMQMFADRTVFKNPVKAQQAVEINDQNIGVDYVTLFDTGVYLVDISFGVHRYNSIILVYDMTKKTRGNTVTVPANTNDLYYVETKYEPSTVESHVGKVSLQVHKHGGSSEAPPKIHAIYQLFKI